MTDGSQAWGSLLSLVGSLLRPEPQYAVASYQINLPVGVGPADVRGPHAVPQSHLRPRRANRALDNVSTPDAAQQERGMMNQPDPARPKLRAV